VFIYKSDRVLNSYFLIPARPFPIRKARAPQYLKRAGVGEEFDQFVSGTYKKQFYSLFSP
jgi:hypothetical protein